MSIEIGGLEIDLNDKKTLAEIEIKAVYSFYGKYSLSKREFANLIKSLQALHDKMVDV